MRRSRSRGRRRVDGFAIINTATTIIRWGYRTWCALLGTTAETLTGFERMAASVKEGCAMLGVAAKCHIASMVRGIGL
jgi:hypothetical protein